MMTNRLLLDRCFADQPETQVAEKPIMGLFRGLPKASVVKEHLTTAEDGQLLETATVKDTLTVHHDENRRVAEARQADAEEISELTRIEKQLERKKEK